MLRRLSALFNDSAETDSRLLRRLCDESPELPEWSAAVQPVLTRLLTRNSIRRPMDSRVLAMPFNAIALPHRTILVAQSLVEFCRDEPDQIAFVLAHEAAHIQLGHSAEKSGANVILELLQTTNAFVGGTLRLLFNRAFGREQEYEADRLAVRFCTQAGYAPEAAIKFLERLTASAGRSTGIRQLLSTHPPMTDRMSQLRAIIAPLHEALIGMTQPVDNAGHLSIVLDCFEFRAR